MSAAGPVPPHLDSSPRLAGHTRMLRGSAAVGVAGLALTALGALLDPRQAAFSYLFAFAYALSLALGALVFLMIQHAIATSWFVVLRRVTESIAATLPLLTLLLVPVLLSWDLLFPWLGAAMEPPAPAKHPPRPDYLALPFAAARAVVYFTVWNAAALLLWRWSVRQDGTAHRMRVLSAAGLPVVAIAWTFASFDWLMSLSRGWYSTVFGVYVFAGGTVAYLALLAVLADRLERSGPLAGEVTTSHTHALGKLLLTFVIFWAYIAFAQLLLVWIADLPEEVGWFLARSRGTWAVVAALLIAGHFAVPFFALLSRGLKRRPRSLAAVGAWMLVMHGVDVYWIVLPALHPAGARPNPLDATALVGVLGVAFAFGLWRLRGVPVVPARDPRLARSRAFFTG